MQAVPPTGAVILLVEYGVAGSSAFPPAPRAFTLAAGRFGEYECFGATTLFNFRSGSRAFQAYVAFGRAATPDTKQRALAILDSVSVG